MKPPSRTDTREAKKQALDSINILVSLNKQLFIQDEHSILLEARSRLKRVRDDDDRIVTEVLQRLNAFLDDYIIMHKGSRKRLNM